MFAFVLPVRLPMLCTREGTRVCLYSFSALADPVHVSMSHTCDLTHMQLSVYIVVLTAQIACQCPTVFYSLLPLSMLCLYLCLIYAYMDRVNKSIERIQADAGTLPRPQLCVYPVPILCILGTVCNTPSKTQRLTCATPSCSAPSTPQAVFPGIAPLFRLNAPYACTLLRLANGNVLYGSKILNSLQMLWAQGTPR